MCLGLAHWMWVVVIGGVCLVVGVQGDDSVVVVVVSGLKSGHDKVMPRIDSGVVGALEHVGVV